ncbi:polyadenylate-binding protein-interacting protein 10-like [Rhodamnia argentea]|uniref:Polyadenylate-binding protein-interacting protein 10-like n=1 Tax=Rhodamnia argentea TaxID=178133 RepID=A0A8B8PCH1_9MYRT|nr:polyadenylate-binding protein-interacting protein 10-like [Rhodamnia argentea]XP_030532368.1 polyadenylate-binding protein-interacting protein 10-like [Rhodamnia argentea]
MAVAENDGVKIGASGQNLDATAVSSDGNASSDSAKSEPRNGAATQLDRPVNAGANGRADVNGRVLVARGSRNGQMSQMRDGLRRNGSNFGSSGLNDVRELVDMLSKLNPMAEEFVPPSLGQSFAYLADGGFGYPQNFVLQIDGVDGNGHTGRRRKNGYSQGKRRINSRTSMAQRHEVIRRTVYVTDIDQQVTEEQLAALFNSFGQVVDCRVCGDPSSCLRFAFVEFTDEDGARAALNLSGTVLGYYPIRVQPSKTAIAPVNPTFLPRSDDEREMCSRTVYCTNIDKTVTQADVKFFFESLCGEVHRLRLLGDYHHSTRIAFVEFVMAESAIAALSCSGVVLGSLPIRVSPSKTPVRPRVPHSLTH